MPRADEPRVTIRLSEVDHAVLSAAAEAQGVRLGTLIREAAMAYARRQRVPRVPLPRQADPPVIEAIKANVTHPGGAMVKTARELALERQRRMNERRS